MNYLSHAFRFLDRPAFALGTQIPDFMNMVDRKARARRKLAVMHLDNDDPFFSELSAGIVQHHDDDHAFHSSLVFNRLNHELGAYLKAERPDERGMRSWFVGHIAVEMILDWSIWHRNPEMMDRLYKIFADVDVAKLTHCVQTITGKPLPTFEKMHGVFMRERFLYDYQEDAGLFYRINRIVERVGLAPFADADVYLMAQARELVDSQWQQLLSCLEPSASPHLADGNSPANTRIASK